MLHTFYKLDDGSYLAFFEAPDMPFEWKPQHDFDLHIALEVAEPVLAEMLAKGKARGLETRGISDHEFVHSIYFRDPNGYVIELTAKTPAHARLMDPAKNQARAILQRWQAAKSPVTAAAAADRSGRWRRMPRFRLPAWPISAFACTSSSARCASTSCSGFTKTAGPMGPEPVAILDHPSGVEVNLVLNAPRASEPNILMDVPEKHPGITHFALLCPDIRAAQARLAAAGIALSGGPVRFGPPAQGIFVRDPDGNVIELHQRG